MCSSKTQIRVPTDLEVLPQLGPELGLDLGGAQPVLVAPHRVHAVVVDLCEVAVRAPHTQVLKVCHKVHVGHVAVVELEARAQLLEPRIRRVDAVRL